MKQKWRVLGFTSILLLCATGLASSTGASDFVDLELLLAVDVSVSVDQQEYLLQMQGLASAFRDPEVVAAIRSSAPNGIAVALMQWAGPDEQAYSVPWARVFDVSSAFAFAEEIDAAARPLSLGGTAIGDALLAGTLLLRDNGIDGTRRVIDVSGDGRANQGTSPGPVRLHAVSMGVTVNGLAILNEDPELLHYYRDKVIAGPGCFVQIANDYTDFGNAIRLKLLREIQGLITADTAEGAPILIGSRNK